MIRYLRFRQLDVKRTTRKLAGLLLLFAPRLHGQANTVFQGTVLNRADTPIEGASIKLKFGDQTLETKSDSKGHFEFSASDGPCELVISARGFEDKIIKSFRISQPQRAVTIILDVGGTLSSYDPVTPRKGYKPGERLDGTVMDEFGAVINNASVTLSSATKTFRTKSDADGGFAFKHVSVEEYKLTISANGFRTKTIEKVTITREDSAWLPVTLEPAERP
jgi:hypothetical protein